MFCRANKSLEKRVTARFLALGKTRTFRSVSVKMFARGEGPKLFVISTMFFMPCIFRDLYYNIERKR